MDEFEELKPGESVLQHLIAGATAGTAEHCGMYPIDTIKALNLTIFTFFYCLIITNSLYFPNLYLLFLKTNLQALRPESGNISSLRMTQVMNF
jgi:hypothetical protein